MRKFVFVIATFFMVTGFVTITFGKTEDTATAVHYELVDVNKGDTLWTIAEEYNTKFDDVRDYIEVIKEFNNMKGSNIRSGESILVPVYS